MCLLTVFCIFIFLNLTQSDKNSRQAKKAPAENDVTLSKKEKKKSTTNKSEKLDGSSDKVVKKKK